MGSAGAPLSSHPGLDSGENSVINPYRVNMYQGTSPSRGENEGVGNTDLSPIRQTEGEEVEMDQLYAQHINEEQHQTEYYKIKDKEVVSPYKKMGYLEEIKQFRNDQYEEY